MTLKSIWRSFQPRLSFPRPFQQSLECFRVARSPSNSWASCYIMLYVFWKLKFLDYVFTFFWNATLKNVKSRVFGFSKKRKNVFSNYEYLASLPYFAFYRLFFGILPMMILMVILQTSRWILSLSFRWKICCQATGKSTSDTTEVWQLRRATRASFGPSSKNLSASHSPRWSVQIKHRRSVNAA